VPDGRSDGPSKARNRDADLATIDSLIDRLVPALTAKLAATHLGELEVREGAWRIRLRRPATAGAWNGEQRRSSDRAGRANAGHDGHAGSRGLASDGHRVATPGGSNGTTPGTGMHGPGSAGVGATPGPAARALHQDETRRVASSQAVGVFRPNARATVGTRVREGDALGHVDVLGIREDVLSPVDGLVGELLAEAGTAVEYGQPLVVVALTGPVPA
jgi:biotin carboxyl carrier protein